MILFTVSGLEDSTGNRPPSHGLRGASNVGAVNVLHLRLKSSGVRTKIIPVALSEKLPE